MSVHQIIYTSCMRGIRGVNDGQQVFSYDKDFEMIGEDNVKSFFSYQAPALQAGVAMTEEIAKTLPKNFCYKVTDRGFSVFAKCTYLGRDYMGSSGRFGNFLSHVVASHNEDIQNYPCEFFGSSMLRDCMDFNEVNNSNTPNFLPTPLLETGSVISIYNVISFLQEGNRMDIFKNMLHAMFSFETARKRLVICDEPENIIMWIAGLEYVLPLNNAKKINFSTYTYDPSLSDSQICGVIPTGSRYSLDNANQHLTFDLINNSCVEFEKDEIFYRFIDVAFNVSVDSLYEFHKFLLYFGYDKANLDIYGGYAIYQSLYQNDSSNDIIKGLDFVNNYGNPEQKLNITKIFLQNNKGLITKSRGDFLLILDFILQNNKEINQAQLSNVKNIVMLKLFDEFSNNINENDFLEFFKNLGVIANNIGFDIKNEMVVKTYKDDLISCVIDNVNDWKVNFISNILAGFILKNNVDINDLHCNGSVGYVFSEVLANICSQNKTLTSIFIKNVFKVLSKIPSHLLYIAFNIEATILSFNDVQKQIEVLWVSLFEEISKLDDKNISNSFETFRINNRLDLMYNLYIYQINNEKTEEDCEKVFKNHFNYLNTIPPYKQNYEEKVFFNYYNKINQFKSSKVKLINKKILKVILNSKISVSFFNELSENVLSEFHYAKMDESDIDLIGVMFKSGLYNNPKLPLLYIGVVLESIKSRSEADDILNDLIRNLNGRNVLLVNSKQYFNWVLPISTSFFRSSESMFSFFNIFTLNNDANLFIEETGKLYFQICKDYKEYSIFTNYFKFIIDLNDRNLLDEFNKVVHQHAKSKINDIDKDIKTKFSGNEKILLDWDLIKNDSKYSKSFMNKFSNMFGK